MPKEESELETYRNTVVEKLQYHYAHGELEENEFEELLSIAINATSRNALVPIDSTLEPIPGGTSAAGGSIERKKYTRFVNIFGGTERKGVWNVPRKMRIVTIFGGTVLNLSQCNLGREDTEIELFCVMGGVEIIVPDNASVDVDGIPFFGGFQDSTRGHNANGPRIRVSGTAFFGGVEVRPMNRRERKRLRKR